MEQPIKYWVRSIAPSGMAYYTGTLFSEWTDSIFVSALVPGDVRRLKVKGSSVLEEEILFYVVILLYPFPVLLVVLFF